MRRLLLALAIVSLASACATVAACSIQGLADGVRVDGGAGRPSGDGGGDGEAPGSTCPADLAHDPANCGRCGRSCSGPCDDGTCEVKVIATGQPTIAALATNDAFVVWSAGGRSIRACPVDQCTTPTLLVKDEDLTGQLALDGQNLLFTSGVTGSHGVRKCPVEDCTDDVSLGFDLGTPWTLAADQGEVFVLEKLGRRVFQCGNGGCGKNIARNTPADGAIALGLTNVYWSVLAAPAGIFTCPRSGCAGQVPQVFASGVTTPRALAVDLDEVRWTSYEDGTVSSCPLAGCAGAPKVLARDQKNPLGIATDRTRVYWANAGEGTVVTCEAAGCAGAPRVVVRGLDRPQWVSLGARYVYFATASGTIGRALK